MLQRQEKALLEVYRGAQSKECLSLKIGTFLVVFNGFEHP